jgi:diguanylate cyclase
MRTADIDDTSFLTRHMPDRFAVAAGSTVTLVAGAATAFSVAWVSLHTESPPANVPLFVLLSMLLVLGETASPFWIRSGPSRLITPLFLFAFSLLLLGPVGMAFAAALAASLMGSATRGETAMDALLRLADVAISLGSAALLVLSWDTIGPLAERNGVSLRWVLATGLAGITILLLNTVVTALHDAVEHRTALTATVKRGVGARVTTEGAMLSLAPIWVVTLDFSVALLPLLMTTTWLVFRATREALERAFEAHHDALTGLANRRAFLERVTESFEGIGVSGASALLLMDLDRFKEINDQLGHEFGDRLLLAFGERLTASLPQSAVVARLGGDEFAVLLPIGSRRGVTDDLTRQLDELRARLFEPLMIEGFPVSVGASIGVAMAPRHGRTPSELLRAADVAMYKAKRRGTAVEHYDDCLQLPKRGRLGLLSELGAALTDHQFRVHYQPQLLMSTGGVDTLEALIRWQHPEQGMIPPGDFIGLAEQTDLIGPITEMVLRMSSFGLLASGVTDAKLALNVSSRSLEDRYFAPLVFTVLDEIGFPAHRLELEVTERALVSSPERSAYSIERLRDAGVTIAIDDFGTGYSSFETLRRIQVDRVKIDAAFVTGLRTGGADLAIVESVIALAHRLGLQVVAEGVETTKVWTILRDLGCDVAQGFGIAHPMTLPDLKGWLTAWNEVQIEQMGRRGDHLAGVREPRPTR